MATPGSRGSSNSPSTPPRLRRRSESRPGLDSWDGRGALGYLTLQAVCDDLDRRPPAGAADGRRGGRASRRGRSVTGSGCSPRGGARGDADGHLTARGSPIPDGGAPLTGTNPLAIAIPVAEGDPVVVDVSMGAVTHGDVLAGLATPRGARSVRRSERSQGVRARGRARAARRRRWRARATARCSSSRGPGYDPVPASATRGRAAAGRRGGLRRASDARAVREAARARRGSRPGRYRPARARGTAARARPPARTCVERASRSPAAALGAGEVVEDVRVPRILGSWPSRTSIARSHSPVVQKRSASAERSQGRSENGAPGRPPTTSTVVAGLVGDGAAARASGSLTKTSDPAGAGTGSPSTVNVARPARTRYSSSWPPAPCPSSSCSPMIACPASRGPPRVDAEGLDPEHRADHVPARPALVGVPVDLVEPHDAEPLTHRVLPQRSEHDRVDPVAAVDALLEVLDPRPIGQRLVAERSQPLVDLCAQRSSTASHSSAGVFPNSASCRPWRRRSSSTGVGWSSTRRSTSVSDSPA